MDHPFEKAAGFLQDPKTLALILGASGLSGLAGGYLSSKNERARRGETSSQRRKRILRNSLYAALAGGGAAALGTYGMHRLGNVKPEVDRSVGALLKKYGLTAGLTGAGVGATLYGPGIINKADQQIARTTLASLAGEMMETKDPDMLRGHVDRWLASGDVNSPKRKALITNLRSTILAKLPKAAPEEVLDNLLIRAGYAPDKKNILSDLLPKGLFQKNPNLPDFVGKAQGKLGQMEMPALGRKAKQFFAGDRDIETLLKMKGSDVGIYTPYGKIMKPAERAALDPSATKGLGLKGAMNPRTKGLITLASMLGLPMLASQTLYAQPEI